MNRSVLNYKFYVLTVMFTLLFKILLHGKEILIMIRQTIVAFLRAVHELELAEAFPGVFRASVAALIIAITSAACERNFSVLRYLKNYTRSVMNNIRLSQLMTLVVENKLLRELFTALHFTAVIDNLLQLKNVN